MKPCQICNNTTTQYQIAVPFTLGVKRIYHICHNCVYLFHDAVNLAHDTRRAGWPFYLKDKTP